MASYGPQTLETLGRFLQLSADGYPEWKVGGITLDWGMVTAVSVDTTLDIEGIVVKSGDKYIRYGTPITRIGVAEVQTVTFTGGPTAGNATITLPASGDLAAETAAAVAFNASAAVMQTALTNMARVGGGGATVARTGAGSAADPYVYTVTFSRSLGNVPQMTSTHTFTGGTAPTTTHGTTTSGTATGGEYGPVDTSVSDGRQTMGRGDTYLLNETVLMSNLGSDHAAVFEGGLVWEARLNVGGTNQGTLTNLLTALPRLRLVRDPA